MCGVTLIQHKPYAAAAGFFLGDENLFANAFLEFGDMRDDADETMAFGDGGNDVAMLRAAGAGVAMGNACDEALAAADYVTASVDDDGIRRALEHFGVI